MKFVLAPDSFKNCMRAPEVATELARGIREAAPEAEIVEIPLSDGGDGFAAAAAAVGGGRLEYLDTVDPLGRPIRAGYARFTPEAAVWLELAAAAGLELLSGRERAPLTASTYGFGRMTAELLKQGCRKFVLGLGGSAGGGSDGHGSSGHAKNLLELADELADLNRRHTLEGLDDLFLGHSHGTLLNETQRRAGV